MRRFDLGPRVRPFSLCLRCNEPLEAVRKAEVRDRLPEAVARLPRKFRRCPSSGRVYWRGTHWESMRSRLGLDLSP